MSVKKTLEKIGFDEKEISVYTTLLKKGPLKHSELSKLTRIKRATVYNTVNSLSSKGIVSEDLRSKVTTIVPLPPQNLSILVEQEYQELDKKKKLIDAAIKDLSILESEENYPVPKITFIEENDLKKHLYKNISNWHKSIIHSDGIWWGFQDHSFVEVFEDWIKWTWSFEVKKKYGTWDVRIFSNPSEIERKMKSKVFAKDRKIKFLDNIDFTATMWICGDHIVMIQTKNHPYYLVEIYDKLLAHNLRQVLKKIWGDRSVK